MMAAPMPGDWSCPACGDLQFARNTACRRCGTPKQGATLAVLLPPTVAPVAGFVNPGAKPGDWHCPDCGDLVFAKNPCCRRCGTTKPQGTPTFGFGGVITPGGCGGFNGLPGDWNCPNCNDLQFARNPTCRRCGTPRPGAAPSGLIAPVGVVKPGDWTCPSCGDLVFGKNDHCRRCQTPNPANPAGVPPVSALDAVRAAAAAVEAARGGAAAQSRPAAQPPGQAEDAAPSEEELRALVLQMRSLSPEGRRELLGTLPAGTKTLLMQRISAGATHHQESSGLRDSGEDLRSLSREQLAEALAESRQQRQALEELLARAREREAEQGREIAQLRERLRQAEQDNLVRCLSSQLTAGAAGVAGPPAGAAPGGVRERSRSPPGGGGGGGGPSGGSWV